MAQKKYYVVWNGLEPGVYTTWEECRRQVIGVAGSKYRSYSTYEEALEAFGMEYEETVASSPKASKTSRKTHGLEDVPYDRTDTVLHLPKEVTADAWAVDAACSGNPGKMEYRGIDLATGEVIFHVGPLFGTNNIGEFLAIVHALALMQKQGISKTIYSDSRTAQSWVRQGRCRTQLALDERTSKALELVQRAQTWLESNAFRTTIIKWDTDNWGEIPADFGRK